MNKIELKIQRLEGDIIRYKEYMLQDLKSNNLNDIESTLNSYSIEILTLIKAVEQLKELIN